MTLRGTRARDNTIQAAFNVLSRYKNAGEPCPRCFQRIDTLAAHLDAKGRPTCRFKSAYEREIEQFETEGPSSVGPW
jgi:hypothetical protein